MDPSNVWFWIWLLVAVNISHSIAHYIQTRTNRKVAAKLRELEEVVKVRPGRESS